MKQSGAVLLLEDVISSKLYDACDDHDSVSERPCLWHSIPNHLTYMKSDKAKSGQSASGMR
jgi:hypothetical protein